jgi:hypothetical protein
MQMQTAVKTHMITSKKSQTQVGHRPALVLQLQRSLCHLLTKLVSSQQQQCYYLISNLRVANPTQITWLVAHVPRYNQKRNEQLFVCSCTCMFCVCMCWHACSQLSTYVLSVVCCITMTLRRHCAQQPSDKLPAMAGACQCPVQVCSRHSGGMACGGSSRSGSTSTGYSMGAWSRQIMQQKHCSSAVICTMLSPLLIRVNPPRITTVTAAASMQQE